MKNLSAEKRTILELLRKRAEKIFESKVFKKNAGETAEIQKLFHELQIHQFELEIQNEELNDVTVELELQRTRFSNLFELAPVGYVVLNSYATITDINSTGTKLFGVRKELLIGKSLSGFVGADNLASFNAFFRRLTSTFEEQACQIKLHRAQREPFYAQLNGIFINKKDLVDAACYLTIVDISEKMLADLHLQEANRRLEMALKASSTGIWEIDLANGNVYLDVFGFLIFGFTPDSFDGKYKTLLSLIHKDERELVDAELRKSMVRGRDFNIDFSIKDAPGNTKYIAARGQITTDQDGKQRFVGTVTDITEKRNIELESRQLKENHQKVITAASLQAEENERKRVSETLHDSIGQMLYAIKLNLQQVKAETFVPLMDNVQHLLDQTIREVRNISFELAPSILQDFGIATTIEEMAERLSGPTLSVQVRFTNIRTLPDINLSLNIFRIVQELVNNSIKHANARQIWIELRKKGPAIIIQVTDNGKGFEPKDLSKNTNGTGISSIRNRLSLYKGSIDMQSVAGQGTTVIVKLKQL